MGGKRQKAKTHRFSAFTFCLLPLTFHFAGKKKKTNKNQDKIPQPHFLKSSFHLSGKRRKAKSDRAAITARHKMSMVKMEVDKGLMDLNVSSRSVFATMKLVQHYIFITFYVVFHDFMISNFLHIKTASRITFPTLHAKKP